METLALTPGTVVKYNNSYALLWKINKAQKAQLLSPDGDKLPGTPSLDKLTPIKQLNTAWWKLRLYAVDKHLRIFSLTTGNIVFENDCPQRSQILANLQAPNGDKVNINAKQ